MIDGVREGRGISVGGPEGVGVSLAVAVGDAVGVGLAVGWGVADAAGNSVAVWVAVGVGVPVGAANGRPARARPPTKPIASAIAPVGPAMSRVRFTAPIYSRRAILTRVPRSGVPWGRIARRSSGRWPGPLNGAALRSDGIWLRGRFPRPPAAGPADRRGSVACDGRTIEMRQRLRASNGPRLGERRRAQMRDRSEAAQAARYLPVARLQKREWRVSIPPLPDCGDGDRPGADHSPQVVKR